MWWRTGLIAVSGIAAVLPVSPGAVERIYSNGLYASLQPGLTSASNLVPFALVDVLIILTAAGWLALAARDLMRASRNGWMKSGARIGMRTLTWAAAAYLLFLAVWGLNYRRVRLVDKLEFSPDGVTSASALAIANRAVDQLNDLHRAAHDGGWGAFDAIDPALADLFDGAVKDAGGTHPVVAGQPKRSLLDWYFRRTAVSGMTDPFFLETLVASDVLPFERPMVHAHEWSHLAGIADEGEANFVAWLACVRGAPPHRYSAWLFLYQELLPSIEGRDRATVAARLESGPRDDVRAIRDRFVRNVNPRLFAVGWRVYDSYLKANRVEAGTASYAEVVRLVLGVRFAGEWKPVRRS